MLYINDKTLIWYSFDKYMHMFMDINMLYHDLCHEVFKYHAMMLNWFNRSCQYTILNILVCHVH